MNHRALFFALIVLIISTVGCNAPPTCPYAPGQFAEAASASCVAPSIAVDVCASPDDRGVTDCLLDFGSLDGPQDRSLQISNSSSLPLEFETELTAEESGVASIVLVGDERGTILSGLSTELTLRAAPQRQGEQRAVFTIRSNAANAPSGEVAVDVVALVE